MSAPAFTEGQWIVNPYVARVDCQQISEKGGLLPVCEMLWPTDERSEDETEANARLIAAAPELYEQLSGIVSFLKKAVERNLLSLDGEMLADAIAERAAAALAKVRGETA